MTDDARIEAKAVASAVEPTEKPSSPAAVAKAATEAIGPTYESPPSRPSLLHGPGWCHSAVLAHAGIAFPPAGVKCTSTFEPKTLVVVGGGLTSAQICDTSMHKGFSKVKLLLRGHMKVKPFDITLDWMGRYSSLRKMEFW